MKDDCRMGKRSVQCHLLLLLLVLLKEQCIFGSDSSDQSNCDGAQCKENNGAKKPVKLEKL